MDQSSTFTRREAVTMLALGGVALAAGITHGEDAPAPVAGSIEAASIPLALVGNHSPLPLPFSAGSLTGISEKLITSHHDNNYGAAVKGLNGVEKQLATITKDTPPFLVAGLHERELTFRNSKTLHEAYFANLGGNGQRSGAIEKAIADAYGSTARWEELFRVMGMGLGGGSGWAILAFELQTAEFRSYASAGHTQTLASSVPLLVMDMYEHSYQMDFGAGVATYIDAFFTNVNWDEVNRRLDLAQKASVLLCNPKV